MANDTYAPQAGGRPVKGEMTFSASQRKWTPSGSTTTEENLQTESTAGSTAEPVNNNPASKVASKLKADKDYIEIEFNTLQGSLVVTPSEKTMPIRVGNTVQLSGFGNYLSGQYYVSGVERHLSVDSGYTQSLTVVKTGFGDSVKPTQDELNRKKEVNKEAQ